MARHEATVEDLLDEPVPAVRFNMRPWRGPLADLPALDEGHLELTIHEGPEQQIVLRSWLGPCAGPPNDQERVGTTKLGAAWLEGRVLGFVQRLLNQA
jgi:hypothetical protein